MSDQNEEQLRRSLRELGHEEVLSGDVGDVVVRGRAIRRARRLVAGGVGASMVIVGVWLGVTALDLGDGTPPRRVVAGAECEVVNDGVPVFPQFHEDETPHGVPGDRIVIEGHGFYAPASKVEVLWNEDVPGLTDPDQPADGKGTGSTLQIATGDLENHCSFRVEFPVPDVPAGTYPLNVRIYDPASPYYISSEFSFQVTEQAG